MWILFAVLGAIAKALTSALRKKISYVSSPVYVFMSMGIVAVILSTVSLFLPSESIGSTLNNPPLLLVLGLINIAALRLNLFAFKHEELSYITPMFALTPIYAALFAFVTIGEQPSALGLLGVITITIGVYIVTKTNGVSFKDSLLRITQNKGARAGMLVPIAYAAGSTINKDLLNQGVTPLASVAAVTAIMSLWHVYVIPFRRQELADTLSNAKLTKTIILTAVLGVGSIGFAALALNDAFTSYTLSIRRLDVLITVIIGWKFMNDSNTKQRLIGAVILTAGVVFVSFG